MLQLVPSPQIVPQAPQLLALDCVSTHWSPQKACPGAQTHCPATQLLPLPQLVAQAPQWALSVRRSKQAVSQRVAPAVHSHFPDAHTSPAPQGAAHAAQSVAPFAHPGLPATPPVPLVPLAPPVCGVGPALELPDPEHATTNRSRVENSDRKGMPPSSLRATNRRWQGAAPTAC
jgi:hypothetical protein